MNSDALEQLKYPIGRFNAPKSINMEDVDYWITDIEMLPAKLRQLVSTLSDTQLDTPYRPQGWTVRQVVHHIPDSHLNSYIRFKWTLTEEKPTIKAYDEQAWANLFDTRQAPILHSLDFLQALHTKWVYLLRGLKPEDLQKSFIHPETGAEVRLDQNIAAYAWHGEHHYMHIKRLLERNNWINIE